MSDPATLLPVPGKKALIFDCDGTLADTFPAHYRAFKAALAVYKINFERNFYVERLGWSRGALLEALRTDSGADFDADTVAQQNAPLFLEHIDAIRIIPVTEALVRRFHGQLKLGVCSGGQKPIVTQTLKTIGLYDLFDTVVTFEDTGVGKPAPDLYLRACETLCVNPQDAHAYEDSDEGIEAAHAAGLSVSDIRPFYRPDPTRW